MRLESLLWQVPLLSPKRATPVGASAKDLPGGKQTAAVTAAASGQPRLAKGWDVLEADFAGLEGTVVDKLTKMQPTEGFASHR